MAKLTIKKMHKELINNHYVSKGENLSDAEIKKLYNQMIADEAAVKEEISMETTVQKLIDLANGYDRFTCYIENYKQEKEAEARNERIMKNFIETAASLGVNITERDFSYVITNTGTVYSSLTTEEAVNNLLTQKGINNNKEDDSMETNTTPTVNNNEAEVKEETVMNTLAERILNMGKTERLMYVWDIVIHVTKTSDELYIKKDMLAKFLYDNDIISRMPGKNELKRTKREVFVDILDTAVQNLVKAKVITPINAVPVSVDDLDITHGNTPQQIEYTDDMSMDILKRVIIQANTNHNRNFISDWMLTSIVSELIIGVPLKGKDENDNWVEFYKTFTDADKSNIKMIRNEFLKRSGFVTVKNEVTHKTTGYVIPAKSLVYGRHTWLGVACVYHYKDKTTGEVTVYHVSRNGVKNVKTGVVTPLDDAGYVKLDTVCTFKY